LIRQAISCDVCGNEKRQTNHWFVAHEQGEELRVSGWTPRSRLRPNSKHLCGQTCVHKLVDEFMARSLDARGPAAAQDEPAKHVSVEDSAYASEAVSRPSVASIAFHSPALPRPPIPRPIPSPVPTSIPNAIPPGLPSEPASVPAKPQPIQALALPEDSPRSTSRNWRAEAWDRERERELRAIENRTDIAARRCFSG
jgi:hypothetical protein